MTDLDISLGTYVKPSGRAAAEGDIDNIDRNEGTVYAIERIESRETGEVFDLLHVVHVHHGTLRFGDLRSDQVGSATPPAPADLDSLIKLAGKTLQAKGRRTDDPYFTVVQVARMCLAQPAFQPDMPSVFGDDEGMISVCGGMGTPRPACEHCGRPLVEGRCAKHSPVDPVTALCARLAQLGNTERNEIRRTARQAGWGYLEPGATLSLGDQVGYDTALLRWERHEGRRPRVAS